MFKCNFLARSLQIPYQTKMYLLLGPMKQTSFLLAIFIFALFFVGAGNVPGVSANPGAGSFFDAQEWVLEATSNLRSDPIGFLADLGWPVISNQDEEAVNGTAFFIKRLQDRWPVLHSEKLDMVASQVCQNALAAGLDTGRTVLEDVSLSPDYRAIRAEVATSAIIMQDYIEPVRAAQILFLNLVGAMYSSLAGSGNAILLLNNDYVEFGVGLCGGSTSLRNGVVANAYLLTMVYARPAGPQPEWIQCGHVYFDKNSNKKYDEGEGLANVKISSDPEGISTQTDKNGQYCVRRLKGVWTLYLQDYPFVQDYMHYNRLLETGRNEGVLYVDYPLLLTQEVVDFENEGQ